MNYWNIFLLLLSVVQLSNPEGASNLNLGGFTSYTQLKKDLNSTISSKTSEAIQYILNYSEGEKTGLLSYTNEEHILFFTLFHSVEKDELILTNLLLETARVFNNNKKKKPLVYFRDWLEKNFAFVPDKVYGFIQTIASGKSKGINDVPTRLAELIMVLDNKYKIFEKASSSGDAITVEWLLYKGFPMKDIPIKILEDLFRKGNLNIVEIFLKYNYLSGRNVSPGVLKGQYFEKQTFLHLAAGAGLKEVVNFLLTQDVDINAKDTSGQTPLYKAVESHKTDIIESLIKAQADLNVGYGDSGDTILHVAVMFKNVSSVRLFVESGISVNQRNQIGETPMHIAAKNFDVNVTLYLMRFNAEVNPKNFFGDTPLHIASQVGDLDCIRLLLNNNAKIDVPNNLGQIPLFKSVESGQTEIIKELLNKSPSSIYYQTSVGDTVMHLAADLGNSAVIETLMGLGATVNTTNNKEEVPLYRAALKGNIKAANILRNATDLLVMHSGVSMLHKAALDGNANAARILLASGISADFRGIWDNTPLHVAAGLGFGDVVKALLEHKANPNIQNKNLMTPLHKAALGGHLNTVELLIKEQADANMKDTSGKTALDLAQSNKHLNVVQYLTSKISSG